ncbi:hypothetical protein N2152v2_007359 [Parachlorella kessleri]
MKSSKFRGVTLFRPTGKWRAQISAGGKTLSLGDHETEQEAARAFDRALLHKQGRQAKTNFPLAEYESEMEHLQAMTHQELVALLRSKARKSGAQSSHYRGVSLLRQTGRWHAQINVGGRQVHLGFFGTEEEAARAYDRAAITKGSSDAGARIITNFALADYREELGVLQSVSQAELMSALADESTRKPAMELLASGFSQRAAAAVFGRSLHPAPAPQALNDMLPKAERALPKPPAPALSPLWQLAQHPEQAQQEGHQLEEGELYLPGQLGVQLRLADPDHGEQQGERSQRQQGEEQAKHGGLRQDKWEEQQGQHAANGGSPGGSPAAPTRHSTRSRQRPRDQASPPPPLAPPPPALTSPSKLPLARSPLPPKTPQGLPPAAAQQRRPSPSPLSPTPRSSARALKVPPPLLMPPGGSSPGEWPPTGADPSSSAASASAAVAQLQQATLLTSPRVVEEPRRPLRRSASAGALGRRAGSASSMSALPAAGGAGSRGAGSAAAAAAAGAAAVHKRSQSYTAAEAEGQELFAGVPLLRHSRSGSPLHHPVTHHQDERDQHHYHQDQQQQAEQDTQLEVAGGRKRRKVARPARAAHS